MATVLPSALPDLAADDGSSRRAFLTKVALGGAALTVGSQLVPATRLFPPSGAQEEGEVALGADETQVRFLASLSLAAEQVYRTAAATALPEPVVELVEAFGTHHRGQATTLVALLPESVTIDTVPANPTVLAEQTMAVEGAAGTDAVLGALQSLEEALAATLFAAVGTLESQDDARLVATLAPVCAQHATVLGALAGQAPADLLPEVQDAEGALSEADNPVGEVTSEDDAPTGDSTTTPNQGGEGAEPGDEGDAGETGDGTESSGGGAADGSGDSATTEG